MPWKSWGLGAVGPISLRASANASSTLARCFGDIGTQSCFQGPSSSSPAGLPRSALSCRTVFFPARSAQKASASPLATESTISALRGVTLPLRTASRRRGRFRRPRASRSIFAAVLALMPSASRA
jgi:hypothetical protein